MVLSDLITSPSLNPSNHRSESNFSLRLDSFLFGAAGRAGGAARSAAEELDSFMTDFPSGGRE